MTAGVSVAMERERQQHDSLVNGLAQGASESNGTMAHRAALPFHVLLLPLHCFSTAFLCATSCPFIAFPLPFFVLLLPFHCFFTAFPLPVHCLFTVGRSRGARGRPLEPMALTCTATSAEQLTQPSRRVQSAETLWMTAGSRSTPSTAMSRARAAR